MKEAVCNADPKVAEIVTGVGAMTGAVFTLNVVLDLPSATLIVVAVLADVLLLVSEMASPPAGAAAVRLIVPLTGSPPLMVAGVRLMLSNDAGLTTRLAVAAVEPTAPVMVIAVEADTGLVSTSKFPLV